MREGERGLFSAGTTLPVVPLPVPEPPAELEGRWAAANLLMAAAIGAVLARAAWQARFRWWFLNLPMTLLVGAVGSIGGTILAYAARMVWPAVLGRPPSREPQFWARSSGAFVTAGWTFDVLTTRLDGRAVWPGTYRWWWTISWPLTALMLFVNATEVQAAGRLTAERRIRTSERTGLKNHYALDGDLAQLARLKIPFSFVYFDLDGFKRVNDGIGHQAGDEVLNETGAILSSLNGVVSYHLHGDEFAFLVAGHDDRTVEALARQVSDQIRQLGSRRSVELCASFGAAESNPSAASADDVRHAADEQMRRAKGAGKHRLARASGAVIKLAEDADGDVASSAGVSRVI